MLGGNQIRNVALLMAVVLVLCGCGKGDNGNGGVRETMGTEAVPADRIFIDSGKAEGIASELVGDDGGWTGEGGCYRVKDPGFGPGIYHVDFYEDELYFHSMEVENNESYMQIVRGEEVLYKDRNIRTLACSEQGIWVLIDNTAYGISSLQEYVLLLLGYDGREISSRNITEFIENAFIDDMRVDQQGRLFLMSNEQVTVFSPEGEFSEGIPLDNGGEKLVLGGDGQMYVTVSGIRAEAPDQEEGGEAEDSVILCLLDMDKKEAVPIAEHSGYAICDGTEEWLYILADDTGMYGVDSTGQEGPPIALWSELGVYIEGMRDVTPLSEGRFLLRLHNLYLLLEPADPSAMKVKTMLTLACVNPYSTFTSFAGSFNTASNEYAVRILDYSENGQNSPQEAMEKLNMDILAGNYPDMFDFEGIPEKYYMDKGLLLDLYQKMDSDPEISREDFIALDKLETDGHLYYAGNMFFLETAAGLYSRFGDTRGWTLEEYLDIQEETGGEMMYNVTKESFLRSIALRYAAQNVDWEAGTCSFDSQEFIDILNAVDRIRESPQPEDDRDADPLRVQLLEGTRVAVLCALGNLNMIASMEMIIGEKLSFIGRPTPDGEGGTVLNFNNLMGICNRGNVGGSWEFMKYVLEEGIKSDFTGLTTNRAALARQLDNAVRAYENGETDVPFDDGDVQIIYQLIDQGTFYSKASQKVMDIVMEEAAAFLDGKKTAEETAAVIQSRVSILAAESK